ncbi:hypothetical protein BHE74_00054895 [Ensete ventricosum]|uniref:Uncharacterized protein n=1 Tax=Ensete ventricosum TaxID=4639 RepID=A0A426XSE7_ENSVE|nr:hypothetical protein B296_00057125 [Ensete ventricosum]RWW32530.1 hypothetical protein GW17_00002788 [Ensete ventricosum]RWW39739.1 hypothetical protein BHE74_00054895 [Ensete ventricosum]RZR78533.1 hypothetical protein BHM03_00003896 [Ensete ventricosum]
MHLKRLFVSFELNEHFQLQRMGSTDKMLITHHLQGHHHSVVQRVRPGGDDSLLCIVPTGLLRRWMCNLPAMMVARVVTVVMAIMAGVVERRGIELIRHQQLPGDRRGTAPAPGPQMAPPVNQEQEDGEPEETDESRPPQGHEGGGEGWRRGGQVMDNEI